MRFIRAGANIRPFVTRYFPLAVRDAGIPVTTDSLQAWEIGRWHPRAPVALALAEFLQKRPKRRHRK
jgi:hypothetical protein